MLAVLSPPHQVFILAIMQYMNPTRAYMKAYPQSSFEAAMSSASDLLRNPNVNSCIEKLLEERRMRAQEVIDRQGTLARGNINDVIEMVEEPVLDRHGEVLVRNGVEVFRQVPHVRKGALEEFGYQIKSIRPANGGGVAVEMYSVQDALAAMERIHKLVQDNPQQVNIEQVVIYMPDNGRDTKGVIEGEVKEITE